MIGHTLEEVSKHRYPTLISNWHTNRPNGINYWHLEHKPLSQSRNEQRIKAGKSHPWPSIKFLLLLHSPQAPQRPILLLYDQQEINDHTKRHIPSVTIKTHTQTYVRTHAHAHSRVHTPPDARTYPDTHTHTYTHARECKNKRSAYTVSRPHLLKHTNLKSTLNVFQLAPLTQIINTATPSFINYHRC